MNEWGTQERAAEQLLAREAGQVHVGPPPTDRIVADGSRIRRRRVWGSGIAAVAVVAAGAAVAFQTPGVLGDGGPTTAIGPAERPTVSVELPEPVEPILTAGPGQWLHVTSTTTRGESVEERETWAQGGEVEDADRERRLLIDGELYVDPVKVPGIAAHEDATVDELHEWLMGDSGDLRGARAAFERAGSTFLADDVPGAFKARLLPALLRVDGAFLAEDADFAGPDAIVVGWRNDTLEERFAFDRESLAFLGGRATFPPTEGAVGYTTLVESVEVVDELPKRARGKGLSMRG